MFCVLYTGVCLVANWLAFGYDLPSVQFMCPYLRTCLVLMTCSSGYIAAGLMPPSLFRLAVSVVSDFAVAACRQVLYI